MPATLAHLIYSSTATRPLSQQELQDLHAKVQRNNAAYGITGMLLYANGSFLQILEGPEAALERLFAKIAADPRHHRVTRIIQESIPQRAFPEWAMGFSQLEAFELDQIEGLGDFFAQGHTLAQIPPGRARKLLEAFAQGRWRSQLQGTHTLQTSMPLPTAAAPEPALRSGALAGQGHGTGESLDFSFAFQPIVDVLARSAYAHEALVRGLHGEPAGEVIARHSGPGLAAFDAACRAQAIAVAARIGLPGALNINILPNAVLDPVVGLDSTIAVARRHGFALERIVIEATESEAIRDLAHFRRTVDAYHGAGMRFAIDDFGAGYSGLNLLSEFQPDIVKLDMLLVRGIAAHGPRQAIARAIVQVCFDLGIDLIVEGVETLDEYAWFRDQGVHLFQGYLFARPMFEGAPPFALPELGEVTPPGQTRPAANTGRASSD